ncbi:thiamine pyrophosphate-binding protein [Micromonospora sp. WMMD1120]|uniref:thiamine pyrophosphate-binding protein n=1 Tax=Micromonospora sp. WMMD1120 TaxID=3016106 RepID=UPI002416AD55|nr:thiamine pyrophosphate-binding protein [Micromonospora sp. WMMD1120]MDG4809347.1 thiamine pyrophosphate-binding protein [Micromonospora sp. WMMD1120]
MNAAEGAAPVGAELLVEALVRHGVDTIFGFPGDTSIHFYDVIARRPQDVRHVLARDERHAAYMADGYARTLRRLGVCEAPSGAGAVYLASGLGEAFASGIPILAIATDNPHGSRGTSAISEIDQMALFSGVTKWRRTVDRAAELPGAVAEAITAATSGRPGPVVLIIPENVLEETADRAVGTGGSTVPAARPVAPAEAVNRVAEQITQAARPAIVAGGGVHLSGAWRALTDLAEHGAIPVGTSIHGKGALAEDHPLALGVVGANGAREYANDYLRTADFVLFAGTRANATDTASFTAPPRSGTRIAHIDLSAQRAGRNYPGSTPLVADVRAALDQLRQALPAADEQTRDGRVRALATARQRWVAAHSSPLPDPGDQRLQPRDVVRALHAEFGGSTWVVADAGTPTPFLASFWESSGDGWRVVIPRGHGPLGFAISAAIGVAVAHPGERILCLTTEGSVAMGLGDWETAGRLGLPITYVVLDNTSLGWIKMIQHLYAGGRYFAVDPGRIDPVLLANGMGLPAARAFDLEQFSVMIKDAAAGGGPSVIHVRVPEHMDNPPPVEAWQAALAGTATRRPIH